MPGRLFPSYMKRRYTKTQMRLSSFPAWEAPDFPSPGLPDVDIAVLDEEYASPVTSILSPAPAPPIEVHPSKTDLDPPGPMLLLMDHLRPFDPWHEVEGPESWVRWFQSHGFPNPLLARLQLSYISQPSRLADKLRRIYTPHELDEAGIPPHSSVLSRLDGALVLPIFEGEELLGFDGRMPDGALLFRTLRPADQPILMNRGIVTGSPRGMRVLVTDNTRWMLEELAMGRLSLYTERVNELPRCWPVDFEPYPMDLCFLHGETESQATKHLLAHLSCWGIKAGAITPETRANRLMALRLSHEAGSLPNHPHHEGLLNRIRCFWERNLHRWMRSHRGDS